MIEADKMLHLRRYVTLLRAGAKSRVARSHLHTSSRESANLSPRGGYVFCYTQHHPVQTHSRIKNYAATFIRTLGTTVPQSSVDDIDHKLMSLCEDIKNNRVSTDSLKEVIKLCDESGHQLHSSTGVLLLKCCGNLLPDLKTTERQDLADQVWQLAKRSSEGLTLEYYNTLLGIYAENSIFVDPKKFLADMNVEPDENTYRLLLNMVAKAGSSKHRRDIMSLMKEKNIVINEDTFNALIQTYVASGNIAEAEHVMTLMRDEKLPMVKTYTELAYGYAKLGDIPNLVKILNDEPQSNESLLRIIKVLSVSDKGMHIPVVLNFLMSSVPALSSEISKLISELIRADRSADAHIIINCLTLHDATKDTAKSFVNSFLNELVIMNAPIDDITKYANDFVDFGCNPLALTNVAEASLKLGRENLSLAIFQAMNDKGMEVRPHYYWPLLATAHYKKGEAKIFELIKSMVDADVEFDSDTLLNYVYPHVNTVNPNITFQRLLINGVPSSAAFTPLIYFLLLHNRLQDAVSMCKRNYKTNYREIIKPLIRAYLTTKDVSNCVTILTVHPRGQEFIGVFLKLLMSGNHLTFYVEDLELLLKEFNKRGAKIPRRDANILKDEILNGNLNVLENASMYKLIDSLVNVELTKSALSFIHPRYMNTKQLACHLVELKHKELGTKNTLRKLLDAYCNENNLKKAEEIKQEYDACQYQWTPGMKMHLFELYVKNNKLQEAAVLLSDLQIMSNKFQLDNIKILMFAIELVKAGQVQKAFEIIDKFDNVNMKQDVQKMCYTLLRTLANSKHYSYTKDMLALLFKKRYCNISVELLRPLVAIPLEHNDIPGAVSTFTLYVKTYKKLPLALELLTALLQQRDKLQNANAYIEEVYEMIVNLSGIEAANTTLVIALAKLNKTQELQTILQEQMFSMNSFLHYFNYAQRVDNVDSLLTLLKVAPNTGKLDQHILCEMLLSSYSKTGDCDGALELWNIMREKDVKPNEKFKHGFTQFLLSNKIPLPPEFEQNERSERHVSNQ